MVNMNFTKIDKKKRKFTFIYIIFYIVDEM